MRPPGRKPSTSSSPPSRFSASRASSTMCRRSSRSSIRKSSAAGRCTRGWQQKSSLAQSRKRRKTRGGEMKHRNAWKIAAAAISFAATSARAEVDELKMMSQYGIGYMQLTIMKADKLVEKHLAKQGLGSTKVTWATMGAGAAANDALLSGSLHFADGGTGPAIILWDRTRANLDVRGVAALSSMPNLLVSRNPAVKTIKDFTEKDRIAMAGAASSVQTTYLQMAAAKEFGIENYKKLNPLMVNLPHPEGLRALLSGQGEVNAQFTSPPFQNMALENPAVHTVLNSYDVMGGPNTFLMVWATKKFREENPKTY